MKCVKAVAVDGMAADVKTCMEVSHCLLKPFKDIDTSVDKRVIELLERQ